MTDTKQTSLIKDNSMGKLISYIAGGILLAFVLFAGICAAYDAAVGPSLDQLEAAYKNAQALHESAITQEKLAAKAECNALSVLAAAKLLAANNGELKVENKEDLAKKASAQCFQEVK